MVGYAPNGYRLWDRSSRKIFIARDIKFDEKSMPYAVEDSEDLKVPLMIPTVYPAEKDDQEAEPEAVVSFPSDDEDSVDLEELPEEQLENPGALPSQTRGDDCLESNTRRSERERKLPGKFFDFLTGFRATSAGNLSPSSDPPESFDEIKARDDR